MSSALIQENETKVMEQGAAQTIRLLAHELRQPLSAVESLAHYLDILLAPGDVRAREQVEKIQTLLEQANWIIDDAVHFTQSSAPHPRPIAIDELVTQALSERRRGGKLNVHLELASGGCSAWMDPQQGRHLLASVLAVFRQIAVSETPVHVGTECRSAGVAIRIACQSQCTATEILEMFEPCNRRMPPGLGLSLASSRRIIEANNGEMRLEESEGQRVVMTLIFPAAR